MENYSNQLDELLKEEGLIPEIFNQKIFTNSFLLKLQAASLDDGYKLIIGKLSQIVSKAIKEKTPQEGIVALEKLVSKKYIPWSIVPLNGELVTMGKAVAHDIKAVNESELYRLMYKESRVPIITAISSNSIKSKEKQYTVRGTDFRFALEDISRALSNVLLYNGIMEFIETNFERAEYVFFRMLSVEAHMFGKEIKGTEFALNKIEELNKKFGSLLEPVAVTLATEEDIIDKDIMYYAFQGKIVSRVHKKPNVLVVVDEDIKNLSIDKKFFTAGSLTSNRLLSMFVIALIMDMHQVSESVTSYLEQTIEAERTYAASYELKKNIPDATIKKMKSTYLNQSFSEVEIDEMMDLADFEEVEKEYSKYVNMFPTLKSASLRFRRLGKYKAGGLYFAHMRAVCVDIRQTSSMIHELCHWLDHSYMSLINPNTTNTGYKSMYSSNNLEFWNIAKLYQDALDDAATKLPDDSSEKKAYYGSSKYNRRYYLDNSEIFARLGEMYFEHKFGSSILWKTTGFAYPKDERLISRSVDFFDRLFLTIKDVSPEVAVETPIIAKAESLSASPKVPPLKETVSEEDFYKPNVIGIQLSLF